MDEQTVLMGTTFYKSLSSEKQELAKAFLGIRLKFYGFDYLKDLVNVLIIQTHANCGYTLDDQLIEMTIAEFVSDLQTYAGTITFQELQYCFKKGWKHEYGKFTGLNNSTYFKWINAYIAEEMRIHLRKQVLNKDYSSKIEVQISEEEKEAIIKRGVITNFETYKRGGLLLDAGNISYEYLRKKGIINLSDEKRDIIREKVKAKIRKEAIENKGAQTIGNAIENALTPIAIQIECKREALKDYFMQLVEMGIDIKDEINE